MKRLWVFLLISVLFSGCLLPTGKETLYFYYPRLTYDYTAPAGVVGMEKRDVTGHRDDLDYILNLYLMGPSDSGLVSALPEKTTFSDLSVYDNALSVTLSDTKLTDSRFLLACSCIALTCHAYDSSITEVSVTSGQRTRLISVPALVQSDLIH